MKKVLFVVFGAFLAGVMVWVFKEKNNPDSRATPHAHQVGLTEKTESIKIPPVRSADRQGTQKKGRSLGLEQFQKKYGSDFRIKTDRDGFITRIRGTLNSGKKESGFQPTNKQLAIERAQQVVQDLSGLIRGGDRRSSKRPSAQNTPYSSKVTFRQEIEGVPLAPLGHLVVDLGPEGQLLSMTSNYVDGVEIVNQKKLSLREARNQLESAQEKPVRGGNEIAWISRVESGHDRTVARLAYEFMVGSHETVVDAETGKMLYQKDQKRH